jgi:hypothetical protein
MKPYYCHKSINKNININILNIKVIVHSWITLGFYIGINLDGIQHKLQKKNVAIYESNKKYKDSIYNK